jgi:hypothetical protein
MTEPPCMDYSAYSLDELWDMVSPPDTLSQAQIAGWYDMAILCADQADNLTRALVKLADFWPPRPGSAAEAFSHLVQGLVASMSDDASNARKMSQSLSGIVGELDSARTRMHDLMDQQAHYQQLPPAASRPGQLSFFEPDQAANFAPTGWEDDLRAQARAIMTSADAKIESIAAAMPVFLRVSADPPQPRRTKPIDLGGDNGAKPVVAVFPQLSGHGTPPPPTGVGIQEMPSPPPPGSQPVALPVGPVLAGTPMVPVGPGRSADVGEPLAIDPSIFPSGRSGAASGNAQAMAAPPPGMRVSGQHESIGSPRDAGVSEAGGNPNGRSGLNGPVAAVPPARPGQPAASSAIRPAGRAALWASQRKRRTADDPWAVRQGVPPVIEPAEPTEADPGPGVIGIDR